MALGVTFAGLTSSNWDDERWSQQTALNPLEYFKPMHVVRIKRPFAGAAEAHSELPPFGAVFIFTGFEPGKSWKLITEIRYPEGDDRVIATITTGGIWPRDDFSSRWIFMAQGGHKIHHRVSGNYRYAYFINGEPLVTLLLPVHWDDELEPYPDDRKAGAARRELARNHFLGHQPHFRKPS